MRNSSRKIRATTRSLSGIIPSEKNEEGVWFESSLEKDFAFVLENMDNVEIYLDQPITIEYYDVNYKTHVYTPDFLVTFSKESGIKPWLCEIKYRNELRELFSDFKPRFKAAKKHCVNEGWEFKIFTEKEIRTHYFENMQFLKAYKGKHVDLICSDVINTRLMELGNTTASEVMMTLRDMPFEFQGKCLYALWQGVRAKKYYCDLFSEPISMSSEIFLATHPYIKY
jgi:hypothetical protein